MNKYVSILGSEWSIKYQKIGDTGWDASTDATTREITLREDNVNNVGNFEALMKKQLRHELIHAFLYESGLSFNSAATGAWAAEEEIVDWIAIQFPKIYEACAELECL